MLAWPLPCAVTCFAPSRRVISSQKVLAVDTGSWQLSQSAFRSITEDNPAADSQTQERPFSSLLPFLFSLPVALTHPTNLLLNTWLPFASQIMVQKKRHRAERQNQSYVSQALSQRGQWRARLPALCILPLHDTAGHAFTKHHAASIVRL